MIRYLNRLVFAVTFVWAGMELFAWYHLKLGLVLLAVCIASGALVRWLYLRAEGES